MSGRLSRDEARQLEAVVADVASGDRELARRLAPPRPTARTVALSSLGLIGVPILLAGLTIGSAWLVALSSVVIVLPGLVLLVGYLSVVVAGRRRYRRSRATPRTPSRRRGRSV